MTTTFLESVDSPIMVKVNDKDVSFPVLWEEDLIPIAAKIRHTNETVVRQIADEQKITGQVLVYMLAKERLANIGPFEVHKYFTSVGGIDECLIISLKKGGLSEDAAKVIVRGMRLNQKQGLAIEVSHIYEAEKPRPPSNSETAAATTKVNDGLGFGEAGQSVPDQPQGLGESPTNPAAAK